jgi:hypothetical protein
MPRLAQELGQAYMDQFYKEAYFVMGDKIHVYKGHIEQNTIVTSSTPLNRPGRWSSDSVPSDAITSMAAFRWPKLGYRQIKYGDNTDLFVYYVNSTRSAMRGLKKQFLRYEACPATALLPNMTDPANFVPQNDLVRVIFAPEFSTYREGLELMRANKTAAVALNEDFALCIPCTGTRNHLYDVLYKGDIVGTVGENGIAVLPNRLRKRHSVYHLFQGQINL